MRMDGTHSLDSELKAVLQAEVHPDERVLQFHQVGDKNHVAVMLIAASDRQAHRDISEVFGRQMGGGRRLHFARDESGWSLREVSEWIA